MASLSGIWRRKVFSRLIVGVSAFFLATLAVLVPNQQAAHSDPGPVVLGAPDIMQISVTDLSGVKNQLRNALGISWGPETTNTVQVQLPGGRQSVQLTRVYSVSSHPYIQLIKANPQVGPWAPFNEQFGQRPRTTSVWRVGVPDFLAAKQQMQNAGLTLAAEGFGFAYFESLSGIQFEIIRPSLSPDPAAGVPNTSPANTTDMGPLNHLSTPVRPDEAPSDIPQADITLRQQITDATGGGITWDVVAQFGPAQFPTGIPYYNSYSAPEQLYSYWHPNLEYNCQPEPFLNPLSTVPIDNAPLPPLAATATSSSFSHVWVVPGSGLDTQAGADAMNAAEAQVLAAGFQSTLRLDAQLLGQSTFDVNIFRYFKGIDNVNIQLLNAAFENQPTAQCTN